LAVFSDVEDDDGHLAVFSDVEDDDEDDVAFAFDWAIAL
jgi:hypothetical protein